MISLDARPLVSTAGQQRSIRVVPFSAITPVFARSSALRARHHRWQEGRCSWAALASAQGASPLEPHSVLEPAHTGAVEVDAALAAARRALENVQAFQEQIPTLPSARFPTIADHCRLVLRKVSQPALLIATCWAIHAVGLVQPAAGVVARVIGGATAALAVAAWGHGLGLLDLSGAKAAFLIGWVTLASSFAGALAVLSFFLASSRLTTFCESEKQFDDSHKPGGHRNWAQVAANSAVPALALAIANLFASGVAAPEGRLLAAVHVGALAYYAGCCGDTWASEIGQLSDEKAHLPSGREVRPGVNGGITLLGTLASAVGGLVVAVSVALAQLLLPGRAWGTPAPRLSLRATLVFGILGGLWGSYLDSVLGASVQFTGFDLGSRKVTGDQGEDVGYIAGLPILGNSGVNLAAGLLNAACMAWMAYAWVL